MEVYFSETLLLEKSCADALEDENFALNSESIEDSKTSANIAEKWNHPAKTSSVYP